jgi:predicted metal-dependent hydrolase
MYLESRSYEVIYVKSSIDGREFLVRNMSDKEEAADLLSKIRTKLLTLVNYLKDLKNKDIKNYLGSDDSVKDVEEGFNRLVKRFKPDNISESTPNDKYTSYSVNKGQKIVFCLRSRSGEEKIVDENIITFVALHELSHIMTKSVGHTEEFWNNFRILLRVGIKLKLYQHQNFNNNPVDYCGTKITDTPLKESLTT